MPHRLALDKLKNDLVAMGEMCEHALATALMALVDREPDMALYVIAYDAEIDEMELAVDRECLATMELASLNSLERRFISAAAKINNDLERIGDLAVEVAKHVLFLVKERSLLPQSMDFQSMLDQVSQMIRESICAVLENDTDLAWKILDERMVVEDEFQVSFREILDIMKADRRAIERACHLLFISHSLRRVADQAANIAEEVIFVEEGVKVRHHISEYHPVEPLTPDTDTTILETKILNLRKSRDQARREHTEAKRATRLLTREEVEAAAGKVVGRVDQAREKLLRLRGRKN